MDPQNFFTCYHCVGYDEKEDVEFALCPSNDCSCTNTPDGLCAKYETNEEIVEIDISNSINFSWRREAATFLLCVLILFTQ